MVQLRKSTLREEAGVPRSPRPKPFLPSPGQIQAEIDAVLSFQLGPKLTKWIERYAPIGHRDDFLWKWCRYGADLITLPCVRPELRDGLCDTKTLGILMAVLLDDVADRDGDLRVLETLLALLDGSDAVLDEFNADQQRYLLLAVDLCGELKRRTRQLPHFAEFDSLLRFDYLQLGNAMRYSHLLNSCPNLLNLTEHNLYTPHNMHIVICSTFDLMASDNFNRTELGRLREIVSHAQWMGRIGNLVTTWERELREKDFTSGVYARAVDSEDLAVDQLLTGDEAAIERVIRKGRHEEAYLQEWQDHRAAILALTHRLNSFDVRRLVEGLEKLLCLHLGSRGLK